jgi:hypothetical protein
MRSFLRATVLALAINPFMPDVAFCQPAEGFEEAPPGFQEEPPDFQEAPPPRRVVTRQRRGWRNSPIVWGTAAMVLAVAIPIGVIKVIRDMHQWRVEQAREKAPWERAMAEYERNRAK